MRLTKKLTENLNVYLKGRKELAAYYGVHPRTLQKWEAKGCRIPFEKNGTRKNASVRIHVMVADVYYQMVKG